MGTSNFHNANCSRVFVIDYGDDDYMWQEATEHLGKWLKELEPNFIPDTYIKSDKELRSFPSSAIGILRQEFTFLSLEFTFDINVFLRSGYYEAANLDIEFGWLVDSSDYYDDADQIISEISYDPTTYGINQGLWTIHKSTLEDKLNTLQEESITYIESLLAQVSTPYGVTAQFSNGETIYTKLKE